MRFLNILIYIIIFISVTGCTVHEKKNFEGIKIIFFAGGQKDDSVASVIYSGAKQAESDFGCKIDYVFSNWDYNKMIDDFKDAIEKKPDGICIMGHPGDNNLMSLTNEAYREGIILTSLNVGLPNIEEKYSDKGFGYAGQDTYKAGYSLAKMCVKKLKIKPGDKVLIWGTLNYESNRKFRSTGCIDYFKDNKINTDYLDIKTEDRLKPLINGYESFMNYYKSNTDLKLIIVDSGVLTSSIPEIFKKAGIQPKKIKCAGFDLSEGTISGIKNGYIDFVNDQQPFLQGYLSVLQICLTKKYGFTGLHINTDSSFIDESNVAFFEKLVKQKIR